MVLAVDGLSWRAARAGWRDAALECLTSTFPSTSATAWMTAVTGAPLTEHLVVGAAYRSPDDDALADVIFGTLLADPHDGPDGPRAPHDHGTGDGPRTPVAAGSSVSPGVLAAMPTVFQAAAPRARPVARAREIGAIGSPWASALLAGASRGPRPDPRTLAAEAADPERMVAAVARDVEDVLAAHREDRPLLLWTYVNLDDHVHRHGYDDRAARAVEALERHALSWARRGWTVLAHSDHGQVPCEPDAGLELAWARVDTPELCRLPAGGAGRTRWLYPREGRAAEALERLGEAMDGHALVVPAADLPGLGLAGPPGPGSTGLPGAGLTGLPAAVGERLGEVVAIATSPRFPLPVPGMAFEHGALTPDEMLVPLATWR
ncbi:hypothetical protein DQ384_06240 [Sphaerisporangium album]|uniref:Alkaline phosphatase family protein n=1 Tax=Sphaerisporangium album TaxID=509200 RepID=A0A367FPA3_9ACTN|nr:alkaline phosphatase family protein [Sphaerisporangium album]RCG32111.1 hypothetical protein DQ384_06240 [Sphaerisporangium album]